MEDYLGRKLEDWETVDHINRDFRDNRIENLRIVERSQHSKDDAKRAQLVEIICVWCQRRAYKRPRNLRGNAKQGKAGPFCGRVCAGKYGAELQNGRTKTLESQPTVISEYYQIKK